MYIAGVPIVRRETKNVYRVPECISLERSMWNASP